EWSTMPSSSGNRSEHRSRRQEKEQQPKRSRSRSSRMITDDEGSDTGHESQSQPIIAPFVPDRSQASSRHSMSRSGGTSDPLRLVSLLAELNVVASRIANAGSHCCVTTKKERDSMASALSDKDEALHEATKKVCHLEKKARIYKRSNELLVDRVTHLEEENELLQKKLAQAQSNNAGR
ncbi:hypothetical protein PENTCL1PPCAC_1298, partial [Pristionchus entomophagus]